MATYEQILRAQEYARNQDVFAMATGLPPGFGAGFKVTWTAPNYVHIHPGAANVGGIQVTIKKKTLLIELILIQDNRGPVRWSHLRGRCL